MPFQNNALQSYQKWDIGNKIRQMLLTDTKIKDYVGDNIFPLIAPENTYGDFIFYFRGDYKKEEVKWGVFKDLATLNINVVSDDYDNSVEIAKAIDNCLTGTKSIDGRQVRIKLTSSQELYEDDKYIQTLTFEID